MLTRLRSWLNQPRCLPRSVRRKQTYRPRLERLEARLLPATFLVTNTGDSGADSLRQAILDANANPGQDVIAFNLPGSGSQVIRPLTPLPTITTAVLIDGYSQLGSSANTF